MSDDQSRGTVSPPADSPETVPIRPAATIMLLRDGADGLEVFMQQRNHGSEFVAGLHVFPGGAVDPEDGESDIYERCVGRDDVDASERTGESSGGLAFWVAAIRETFEEAGLLLALKGGSPLHFDDPTVAARFDEHRTEVDQGRRTLLSVCRSEELMLDVSRMHYHSRWITPLGPKRRYDTRFFVAPMPTGQIASKDNREAIADLWIAPKVAVAQEAAGELNMLIPTLASLRELATHDDVASALAASAPLRDVPGILPRIIMGPNGREALLPGDPGYDQ